MTLRAATVGCGRMGAFHTTTVAEHAPSFWMPISHLGAIVSLPGMDPVACCDVSEDSRTRAQTNFSIPSAYADAEEMLARERIELLTIATRTPQKTGLIEAVTKAGVRAIHVEKPLCNTEAELARLRDLIGGSELAVTFGCLRRYLPPYKAARKHSRTEAFGELVDIHIEMGNAPLMWALVHGLDQLLYYAHPGKPVSVQAWFDEVTTAREAPHLIENDPRFFGATVLFNTGVTGRIGRTGGDSVTLSSVSARIEVFGDGGQVFASAVPEGGIYQNRVEIDWTALADPTGPGGSAAPIALLRDTLAGSTKARAEVAEATAAMFTTQVLIFDMLWSHLSGGGVVETGTYPDDIGIMGISYGNPA